MSRYRDRRGASAARLAPVGEEDECRARQAVETLVGCAGDHVDARAGQAQLLGSKGADRIHDDANAPGSGQRRDFVHRVEQPGRSLVVDQRYRVDVRVGVQRGGHHSRIDGLGLGGMDGQRLDTQTLADCRQAIAVDAVPADQEVMPFAHRRADHGLHRGRARAGDEGELPVAADAGDAEQLLADPREHLGVLGLAVAQVRACDCPVDTVADYRGPGVEQYPLAMMPARAVQVRVHHREVGRFHDSVGLAAQKIEPARMTLAGDADDRARSGALAGNERLTGPAHQAQQSNVRNVDGRERNQQPERRGRERTVHDYICQPSFHGCGRNVIWNDENHGGAVFANLLEVGAQNRQSGRREIAGEERPHCDRAILGPGADGRDRVGVGHCGGTSVVSRLLAAAPRSSQKAAPPALTCRERLVNCARPDSTRG